MADINWEDAPSSGGGFSVQQQALSNDAKLQQINSQWPTGGTLAQLTTESGLDSNAVSPKGARGPAQVMPTTQASLEKQTGRKFDPYNNADALQMQFELMKQNLQKFGNPWDALRAYNGGWNPNTWNNPETSNYVPQIQSLLDSGGNWEDAPNQPKTIPQQANDQWEDAPQQGEQGFDLQKALGLPSLSGLPGAAAAATDIIGGIPGAVAGAIGGLGQAISTGSLAAGVKTGEEITSMLAPSHLAQLAIDKLPDGFAKQKAQEYLSSALSSRDYQEPMGIMQDIYEKGSKAMGEGVIQPIANQVLGFNVTPEEAQTAAKAGFLGTAALGIEGGRGIKGAAERGIADSAGKIDAAEKAVPPAGFGEKVGVPETATQAELFPGETPTFGSENPPVTPYESAPASSEIKTANEALQRRQMELQLEDQPTLFANEEGVTSIPPEQLDQFREAAKNQTDAERMAEAPQGELFNEINQRPFDQFVGEEARTLNPDEFRETLENLSQTEGTRFNMPEDIDAAYNKYLDTVSDKQGGLFDRPTIAENFAKLARDETLSRMVDSNPVVRALADKVTAQEQRIAGLGENLPPWLQKQEQAKLDNLNSKLDTARENISNTLFGKQENLFPYAKDGIVYMHSGLPIPKWILDGVGSMLRSLHGMVFKFLNNRINGPRNIHGIADTIHDGLKQFVNREANRVWETKVDQVKSDFITKDSALRNYEAVKDFIPSEDKPYPEIKKMAQDAPDANISKATEKVAQGGQMLTQLTRNPIVKYVFDNLNSATKRADARVKELLTDAKTGLRSFILKMSDKERGEIHTLMDRNEGVREFTDKQLRDSGFNDKQIAYYKRFREVMDDIYNQFSAARKALGMPDIPKRTAYMASRFIGDFRQLVYKKGTNEVVGFLGHDNKYTLGAIQRRFEEMNPGQYDFGKVELQKSDGSRGMSRFQGYQNALDFLSKTNADVAKIVDAYQNFLTQDANRILGAQKHFKYKSETPVFGAEGKKAWQSVEKNANDSMKAQLQYAEHMIKWSEMQQAADRAKQLLSDPDVNKPRAKQIAQNYLDNALGHNQSVLAKANNAIIDAVAEATGFGQSYFRNANSFQKSQLLSLFLGYLRIPHSVINLSQFFQSNPGVMALLKSRGLDMSALDMTNAMGKGLDTAMKVAAKRPLDAFESAAHDYAKANGVFNVDLTSHLKDITGSETKRKFDHLTEMNITIPEAAIRSSSFFGYAHMLKDAGLSIKDALGAADNMTRYGMVDYRPLERPQIYSDLGFFGDIASTLTRFKMNQLSQYLVAGKELGRSGSVSPLASLLATSAVFGGVTGLIGYNYANEIYKLITKEVFNKPDSLDGVVMRNMNNFAQYGVFSQLGINLSASFSNADIIPDDPFGTLFPTASTLGRMAKSVVEAGYYHDVQSAKKLAYNFAPSSVKGIMENMMFTDKNGNFYNPNTGELQTRRNQSEQTLRNFAFRPVQESNENITRMVGKEDLQATADLRDRVMQKIKNGIAAGTISSDDYQKLAKQFTDLHGDPNELAGEVQKYYMARNRTALERAQGIPSGGSLGSVYQYQTYEENKRK